MSSSSTTIPDDRLLAAFSGTGDQAALAALVERHAGMVFGAALRRTGDAELAREVTQQVFIDLTRKASRLDARHGLGPWLHRAAVLLSNNALRSGRRRHLAMKRYAEELSAQSAAATAPPESSASGPGGTAELLDAALDALPAKDRALIFQRFYEDHSYRALGAREQRSEDAMRRRVGVILQRLSRWFRRRGIVLPAAAAGGLLAAKLQTQAPAAVLASLTPASLFAATASGGSPLTSLLSPFLMNTAKFGAVAALTFSAAIPLGYQWISAAPERPSVSPASTGDARAASADKAGAVRQNTAAGDAPASASSSRIDLAALARDLKRLQPNGEPAEVLLDLQRRMLALTDDELPEVAALLKSLLEEVRESGETVTAAFFSRWAETDAAAAAAEIMLPAWNGNDRSVALAALMRVWAGSDAKAAIAWLDSGILLPVDNGDNSLLGRLAAIVFERLAEHNPAAAARQALALKNEKFRSKALRASFKAWAERDGAAAVTWAEALPDETERLSLLSGALQSLGLEKPALSVSLALQQNDPLVRENAVRWSLMQMGTDDPAGTAEILRNLPAGTLNENMAMNIAPFLAAADPEAAASVADTISDPAVARTFRENAAAKIAASDPARAASLVSGFPEDDRKKDRMNEIGASFARLDPQAGGAWLESLPPDSRSRDYAIAAYAAGRVQDDPEAALRWVDAIGKESRKTDALRRLGGEWLRKDRAAAETWLKSETRLPENLKQELLAR